LKIGEFARMGSVSVPSLRHYHERGLLVPDAVDPNSGYRMYSASQLPRLTRIVVLKELGFTLDQIEHVIAHVTVSELRGMLLLRRTQIEAELTTQQHRLRLVEARLRAIEREGSMPQYDIVVKRLPEVHVATVGGPAESWESDDLRAVLEPAYERLRAILTANAIDILGSPFSFYVGDPDANGLFAYAALPIPDSIGEIAAPVAVAQMPAVDEALSVVVADVRLETFAEVYADCVRFAAEHGYELVGAFRECLVTRERPADDRDTVLEIQQPVQRAGTERPAIDPVWLTGPS
jgi:DNA-binding transcriptional MerR regulator